MSVTIDHLNPGPSQEEPFPAFNSDTFSNLAQKIKGKLEKRDNGVTAKHKPAKSKVKKVEASRNSEEFVAKSPTLQSAANPSNGKKAGAKKQKPKSTAQPSQGKKRLRDGVVKETSHQKVGDNVNRTKLGNRVPTTAANGISGIDEDIRALGGTQDDIDLIANAPSDSEVEGDGIPGNDIQTELQQLIRQLGVDKMSMEEQLNGTASENEAENTLDEAQIKEDLRGDILAREGKEFKEKRQGTKPTGKGHASLAFQPRSEWHTADLPALAQPAREILALPMDLLTRLHAHAKEELERENKEYATHSNSASSAHQFYSTIMSTGTLSDKISALTLSVQESPIHNMKALESLVGLARKRSRGQAVEVLGALKDLFGPGNLLPSDRKLRTFVTQPALSVVFDPTVFQWTSKDPLPEPLKNIHLISWAYEDWLKALYFEVLKIMESWSNDEVVFARGKAVDYICQLLKDKPEQEANLLRLLVNKLGDSDKKIASKTSFHILQLETTHPLMKPTIIAAIEADLLFRSGQSLHAKYYATITLNQTLLSGKEDGATRKLLDIYFNLFVKLLEKPKAIQAAATGTNEITINKKGEVQGGGAVGGKKALKKIAEKQKATTVDEELREKMLSAVLTGVNRAIPFTNTNDESFEKHVNTLFKVTHSSNFNTSIQALMLIQQLNGSHQGSVDRFYRTLYESLLDPRLLTSSKQALYLNLVFRALRSDLNVKRVKAFAKRLLQVVSMHQPSFTCGTLYLLRELEGIFANLETFIDQPEEDSDEEENFKDVEEASTKEISPPREEVDEEAHTTKALTPLNPQRSRKYDGRKRDPEHSNADRSSLWELTPFLSHYHPSVSLFATRLLTHNPMPPKPDLSLNTLIHFLDRFVYRNPKTTNAPKGASIMQPMAGGDPSALLVSAYSGKDRSRQPVNSEAFWKQESSRVGADEVFFHKYFSTLGRGREKAKKKKADKKKDTDGSDSEEGDEDEDEIWRALVDSRPELDEASDGGIFSDADLDSEMDDLDDDDDDDKDESIKTAAEDNISLDLDENSDDALLNSDDEAPSDLDEVFKSEVQIGKNETKGTSLDVPEEAGETRGAKKRRLKSLPTFASADDYAKLLDEDDDD